MQCEAKERWLELCELAAKEQDPRLLLKYVEEINRLLDEKQQMTSLRPIPRIIESPLKSVS